MVPVTFRTLDGIAVPAVSAAQMRELDRICLDETGPGLLQMMENAGRSLAELAMEKLREKPPPSTLLVLAGPGGNGGGGLCAARHISNHGFPVHVCLVQPERLKQVPKHQREILASTPAEEITPGQLPQVEPGLILDALLGYSLVGPPGPPYAQVIEYANNSGVPILSLDLPSGLDPTTGEIPGVCIEAGWTLTLALPKTGLTNPLCGELFLADLGIPAEAFARLGVQYASPFGSAFRVSLVR